jgi:hypothetical protein
MNILRRIRALTRFVRSQSADMAAWVAQQNQRVDRIEADAEVTRNEVEGLRRFYEQQQRRGTP